MVYFNITFAFYYCWNITFRGTIRTSSQLVYRLWYQPNTPITARRAQRLVVRSYIKLEVRFSVSYTTNDYQRSLAKINIFFDAVIPMSSMSVEHPDPILHRPNHDWMPSPHPSKIAEGEGDGQGSPKPGGHGLRGRERIPGSLARWPNLGQLKRRTRTQSSQDPQAIDSGYISSVFAAFGHLLR